MMLSNIFTKTIKMKTVQDRFIEYVKYDTESDTKTGLTPSTPGQMEFANILVKELLEIGMSDVTVDENGYVMACLPSNDTKIDASKSGKAFNRDQNENTLFEVDSYIIST